MDSAKKTDNNQLHQDKPCQYRSYFVGSGDDDADDNHAGHNPQDCICTPAFSLAKGNCTGLSNRWAKESFEKKNRHPRQRGLIAYLRAGGASLGIEAQRKVIGDYCHDNEYYVKETFIDNGRPGAGLQGAIKALDDADGLIASDLNRFVVHHDDRLRDLRPFVHHFFCHPAKHLITVEEGVDTGSTVGQANVVTVMNQLKECY